MAEDDPDLKADLKAWREWNEKPVPLSAIRALVQQWRERRFGGPPYSEAGIQWLAEIERMATDVEALCPAPPEDQA